MNRTITLAGKEFIQSIRAPYIDMAVELIRQQLNTTYEYQKEKPILLVVLNGAVPFAMDLLKGLTFDFDLDFIKFTSYEGMGKLPEVDVPVRNQIPVEGREVILIEDIVDTGHTVHELTRRVLLQGAARVETATLLFKPDAYNYDYRPRYVGTSIENEFVVGYGMDYKGLGRGLKDIYKEVK